MKPIDVWKRVASTTLGRLGLQAWLIRHHSQSMICCPESCACWDVQAALYQAHLKKRPTFWRWLLRPLRWWNLRQARNYLTAARWLLADDYNTLGTFVHEQARLLKKTGEIYWDLAKALRLR